MTARSNDDVDAYPTTDPGLGCLGWLGANMVVNLILIAIMTGLGAELGIIEFGIVLAAFLIGAFAHSIGPLPGSLVATTVLVAVAAIAGLLRLGILPPWLALATGISLCLGGIARGDRTPTLRSWLAGGVQQPDPAVVIPRGASRYVDADPSIEQSANDTASLSADPDASPLRRKVLWD